MNHKKPFIVAILLLLSTFYLYVLHLAANPNVSVAYRQYYLDGTSHSWQQNVQANLHAERMSPSHFDMPN